MEILRTLLEISIYAAAIFAGIMLFKKLTRGKVSPVLSFALWFLLLARLCVPLTVQTGVHLFTLPETQPAATARQAEQHVEEANTFAGGGEGALFSDENQTLTRTDSSRPSVETSAAVETAPAQGGKPAFMIGIYDVLLLVWLGVMAAMLIWRAYIAARVSNVVKKKSVPASGRIEKIYSACSEEAGVKKRLPLLITEDLFTPALAVSFKPKILLPLRFVQNATDAQIKLALRHEITHYRRMDHLVCILMRVLTAVYWFNPVVWLAEREIISDMETACDNSIVKNMKKTEKTYYANMILSMFSKKAEAPFVLGMALSNTRNIAEKRIRGIYMKSKTKKSVKTAALLLSMALMAACFTTACQPVQADQADAGLPEEVIFAAADAPEQSEEPTEERYQDSVQLADGIHVGYDAAVIEPEGPLPVATMEFREFTEADFEKVSDYFFAGEDIYKPWARTKAEVQEEIDALEQENAEIESKRDAFLAANPWAEELYEAMDYVAGIESKISDPIKAEYSLTDEDLGEYMDIVAGAASMLAMNNYTIENDREELETAPDIREKEPAVIEYADVNMGRVAGVESGQETLTDEDMIYNQLNVWTEGENGDISEVGSTRLDDGRRSSIYYNREITPSPYGNVENTPPLTIPQEDALKLAEDAVAAICPEMTLAGVVTARYYDYKTQDRQDAYDAYYEFTFTRDINGVPITTDSYGIVGTIDNETGEVAFYEMVQVMVDDDGILGFSWRAPYENIRVTQEDAPVLSFEEAREAFEKNTLEGLEERRYMDEATEEENGFGLDLIEIDIDKIQLGLTRVTDEEGGFELVPTWDFFGTAVAYRDGEEQRYNRFGQSRGNESLGTVNALDGTIVNRAENSSIW
jgi:beta-lactamase regulating signal transducer with metallopeptidase domain